MVPSNSGYVQTPKFSRRIVAHKIENTQMWWAWLKNKRRNCKMPLLISVRNFNEFKNSLKSPSLEKGLERVFSNLQFSTNQKLHPPLKTALKFPENGAKEEHTLLLGQHTRRRVLHPTKHQINQILLHLSQRPKTIHQILATPFVHPSAWHNLYGPWLWQ